MKKYSNEMMRQFMEKGIPFNDFLGMEVVDIGEGEAEMRIGARAEFTGDPFRPALHGGVISALADTVGGLAVFTAANHDKVASTVDLRVDYLRPGAVDQDLHARAKVIRLGNRVAATHTVVFQADPEKPIATAQAVYNMVTRKSRHSDEPGDDEA